MTIDDVVNAFFTAIENVDTEALGRIYADNVRIWHNFSQATQTKAENIEMLRQVGGAGQLRYAVTERLICGQRAIQRHDVHFTSRSGQTNIIPAVIFMTIVDGRIVALDEYVDSAQMVTEEQVSATTA